MIQYFALFPERPQLAGKKCLIALQKPNPARIALAVMLSLFQLLPRVHVLPPLQIQQLKRIAAHWPVFCDQYGERPSPNCVYDQWDTYRKHHGIRSNLHELRHTFISVNKSDLPLELMKSVVGHSQSMDTYGVYGHEIEGERHRAATIIDGVFRGILNDEK